jgi:4-hydroxybenzoate polyprenyltransferase
LTLERTLGYPIPEPMMNLDPLAAAPALEVPNPRRRVALAVVHALRPRHWAKNVLVFIPLLAAHRAGDPAALLDAVLAFAAFSLVASAVYVVNDLADLASDRAHPRKRLRPFAAGVLSPALGVLMAAVLTAAAAALAARLEVGFQLALGGYAVVTSAYSFALKRQPILDVLVLAGLYTGRIFAGGFATGIPVSEWLANFSMFLFLSLALLKRASDMADTRAADARRGYRKEDADLLVTMGTSASYLSVLVLALYVSSHDVRRLYAEPRWLWALCPLVLFWTSRFWLLARRGEVNADPVLYALGDRTTWAVAALGAAAVWAGS